jgi:uncharacterized membrane protein YdjX (TVP38/TMEM64 family)
MRLWAMIVLVLLAVILIPFLLFENASNAEVAKWLTADRSRPAIAIAIVVILALDVFLPVPSSVVSTAAGALLGVWLGALVSTAGMTLGCVLAYWSGRKFGLPLVRRMVRARDLDDVRSQFCRGAVWALTTARPVPVLAEASTLFAGLAGVPFSRYLLITTLANTGISLIYSVAGASARQAHWFFLAFLASCAIPGLAMLGRSLLLARAGR